MSVPVSIIIPVYKDWERLESCLNALHNQTYPHDKYEIIVVNNESDETIPFNIDKFPRVTFIHEAKPGSYAARNTGIIVAKGEIIGFTDSDCFPDKDWIKNAIDFLTQNRSYTRLAGPVKIIQRTAKPTVIEAYNHLYAFPQKWLINNGGGSVTANLFTYKSVFDAVGVFDESLFSMGDRFWGMKAQAAGFKIAYVENVVVHHPPRNLKELIKKEKRHGSAVTNKLPKYPLKMYLKLAYDCRPRLSGLKFMLSRKRDRGIVERISIPFLRNYLLFIRGYESIKISQGKKKPSRI